MEEPLLRLGLPALALIDATSVGTLVIPLMLLVTGRGARSIAARTAGYLLVIGLFYWLLGLALLAGLLPLYERAQQALAGPIGAVVLAAAGAALVIWSWAADPETIRKRGGDPEASGRRWAQRARAASGSWRLLTGLAVLAGAIEAASMIPYLAAMTILAETGTGLGRGALVLLGYCALMISPGLVLAGIRALLGEGADRLLDRLELWAVRHASSAFSWAVGAIGVIVLVGTVPRVIGMLGG